MSRFRAGPRCIGPIGCSGGTVWLPIKPLAAERNIGRRQRTLQKTQHRIIDVHISGKKKQSRRCADSNRGYTSQSRVC
jgi:hypothetical protein